MPKTRDIRRRIRGVHNTRKVTHAMELVAATKMRRAEAAMRATRRYSELAWGLLREVAVRPDIALHPLLAGRFPVRRRLLLVVAGNRGLVGAFNAKIVQRALASARGSAIPAEVVTAGRVAARQLQRAGVAVTADFPKKDLLASPGDASPIAEYLLGRFLKNSIDLVQMVYADYVSAGRQEPRVRTLLPVGSPDPDLGQTEYGAPSATPNPLAPRSLGEVGRPPTPDYVIEPSPTEVLSAVVPNLVSIQIYQALLETTASEHAARMLTMKNATENADELTDELTLTLNQARQQQITRELQEIVAGALV